MQSYILSQYCLHSAQLWLRGLARAPSCSLLSAERIGTCCHPAFSGFVHPEVRPLCSAECWGGLLTTRLSLLLSLGQRWDCLGARLNDPGVH